MDNVLKNFQFVAQIYNSELLLLTHKIENRLKPL